MKNILFGLLACIVCGNVLAQTADPVSWNFSCKKISAEVYELQLTATVEEEWHIYSQNTGKGGPVPTSISFRKNPLLVLEGTPKEVGKVDKRFEPLFGVEVIQFSDKVTFVQKLKLKGKAKTSVDGTIEYMTCNDHECMPPTRKSFSVAVK